MKILVIVSVLLVAANTSKAQWEPDVRLTIDTNPSLTGFRRSIAASGNTIHIVWRDYAASNDEICYRRSIDGGISWGSNIRLTSSPDTAGNACIAVSGAAVHVIWNEKKDGNYEIFYRNSTDGGTTWLAETRLTNAPGMSYGACIATTASDVHVVWTDQRDGNNEVYYKRSSDNGFTWCDDYRVTNDSAMSYNTSVSAKEGLVHIVWEDARDGNGEIYYKRSTDSGIIWGPDTRLTTDPYSSNLPISAISNNDVHIAWSEMRHGNYEIYYKHSTDDGITWGVDTRLTNASGKSSWASISASGSGVHLVWMDNRNLKDQVFYKCSTDGGQAWSTDTLLINNQGTASDRPSITTSDSHVHLAWTDMRDVTGGEIYYKRNANGNISGIHDLQAASAEGALLGQNYPNPFALSTNTKFLVTQRCFVNISVYDVYGRKLKTLLNEPKEPGGYVVTFDVENFLPGTYFLKMHAGSYTGLRKVYVRR